MKFHYGGRGGIRTHGSLATTSDFESDAFNHSATLPAVFAGGPVRPPRRIRKSLCANSRARQADLETSFCSVSILPDVEPGFPARRKQTARMSGRLLFL